MQRPQQKRNAASQGEQVDHGDAGEAPSEVLTSRRAQEDPGEVIAVPSAILVAKRAQVEPGLSAALPRSLRSEKIRQHVVFTESFQIYVKTAHHDGQMESSRYLWPLVRPETDFSSSFYEENILRFFLSSRNILCRVPSSVKCTDDGLRYVFFKSC